MAYQALGQEEAHNAVLYPEAAVWMRYSIARSFSGATYLGVEELGARRLLILEGGQTNVATER